MRNLKKFLALVMAMVMSFSLMLTANAASKYDQVKEWTDKDQVTEEFVEAVDVLSGMKIFQGDDRGFAPGATITRAETAALIYRLATGDVDNVRAGLYANYGNFADVNEGDWFAGYVGYCANAGYIKGHGGYFNPYAPVTGYEALAMILRAVGYDKNHEFEGATWQTNVSALGTRLGVLDDVRTSDYANTLHLPSRRDVVASILFNTADTVATVTWTPALGYETQKVSIGGGTSDGWNGSTLGWINFGLTKVEGIIVGNQDTGESKTIINTAVKGQDSYNEYFYDNAQYLANTATAKTTVTTSAKIDAKTGIDMFGHKVKAWYCNSSSANGAAQSTTFALYDNVKKTALVAIPAANNPALSNDGNPDNAPLGVAAQKAGFSVDLKDSKAVFNQDFSKSGTNVDTNKLLTDYNKTGTASTNDGDPLKGGTSATMIGEDAVEKYPLYLLISNNSDLTVDMVVAVNVEVSRVSQVNNYATYPTVTVPTLAKEWNVEKTGAKVKELLLQTSLTATSTKTLGEPVVGVAIEGTKAYKPGSNAVAAVDSDVIYRNGAADGYFWRRLSKPTSTVEGTVTNFNYTGNGDNQHTGSIVIGGQRIERSLLADAIVAYDPDVNPVPANRGILNTKPVNLSATAQLYGNYRAYLDSEGKYIWVEPIYETKFVYATYLDYTTPYGSSSYEYTLIGVDLNGEQVKQVVKTVDGQPIGRNNYQTIAPYRDSSNVAGVTPLSYIGYLLDGDGNLTTITDSAATKGGYFETISPRVNQAGNGDATVRGILGDVAADVITVTSTDARLGTKNLENGAGSNEANAANTYFTNDTKFIVVDGAGTDTQKIEVYNGMTEFLRGGSRVSISGNNALIANGAYLAADPEAPTNGTGTNFNRQMYYTQSPLTYASVQGNPMKIDTIVLPKQAITWTGLSGLYYVGNPAQDSEIKSGKWTDGTTDRVFHLYTMYLDGEAQQVWLTNAPGGTTGANATIGFPGDHALVKDTFYKLYDTGLKTPMGDTVYVANDGTTTTATTAAGLGQTLNGSKRPDLANGAEPILGDNKAAGTTVYYEAATYASQTAIIGTPPNGAMNTQAGGDSAIFNVAGAKVVNLNAANSPTPKGLIWPGITDLGTLNDASSTAVVYQTNRPKVSVQVDPTNNLQVTVIYVCWDQN